MIHVLATIELEPGSRAAWLAEFCRIIPEVRAEAGCIEYGPAVDAETDLPNQHRLGPDRVMVVEKWSSLDALKAHAVAPHMKSYRAAVKAFVKGMELRVMAPAG